jgi:hypothetical protein
LALSAGLIMGKNSKAFFGYFLSARQAACMNKAKGIIIGAVNCLQLNKWHANGLLKRGVWQLIAIFDKIKSFGFMDRIFVLSPPDECRAINHDSKTIN